MARKALILVLLGFGLTGLYLWVSSFSGLFRVAEFDLGNDRELVIYQERSLDGPSTPVCYEIRTGDSITVPMTDFFYCTDRMPEFQLITDSNERIVGLVAKARPHVLLIVHDLLTDESYPRQMDNERFKDTCKRGRRLMQLLQLDHPAATLVLHN